MTAPLCSVILCTHNRRRWLGRAIRSVLGQTHQNLELIVCRDGGDPVRDIIQDFNDPRIVFIDRDENRGYGASLNECFGRARGQYVAYLGDDDLFYPRHLGVCVNAMEAAPSVGAAYTDLLACHANIGQDGRIFVTRKNIDISRDWDRFFTMHYNHVLGGSLVHRRELLDKIGPMDTEIRVLVDWSMIRRMAMFTDFIHLYDIGGEFWRYDESDSSDRISDRMRRDKRVFDANMRRIRAERPPKPWPMMPDTAIILPARSVTGKVRKVLADIAEHTWCPRMTYVVGPEWERHNLPASKCARWFVQNQRETFESAILRCLQSADADFATIIHPKSVVKAGWIGAAIYNLAQSDRRAVAYPLANQPNPVPSLYRREELICAMQAHPGESPRDAARLGGISHESAYPDVPLSFDGGLEVAGTNASRARHDTAAVVYSGMVDQFAPRQWGNPLWMAESQAREHIQAGRDDLALPLLTRLAQDRPTPGILHALAGLYRRQGMPEQARMLYNDALAMLKE